jgi:hypothetical protein
MDLSVEQLCRFLGNRDRKEDIVSLKSETAEAAPAVSCNFKMQPCCADDYDALERTSAFNRAFSRLL